MQCIHKYLRAIAKFALREKHQAYVDIATFFKRKHSVQWEYSKGKNWMMLLI
jgi:hypothetical protein